MNGKSQTITQSTILAMGWTKTMIKNLLPEPTVKPNPHYECASPMKLWEKEKVLEIMETDDFKQALEKSKQFAWLVCGRVILQNLLEKNDYQIQYPLCVDTDGDFTYFGKQFKMITKQVEVVENDYS